MRTALRLTALAVALVAVVLWFFGGMNRGWTVTTVWREVKDPVTDIVARIPEKQFRPGIEFLGAGMAAAALLAGASFIFRKK
jgi:hypothetical protein